MSTPTPETLMALVGRLRRLARAYRLDAQYCYGKSAGLAEAADELAALLDTAPPALTREPAEAPGARRCATCVWWGDGDDRRVDSHGIEIAPCQHPRSPVDEYPDGAFGCVLHEETGAAEVTTSDASRARAASVAGRRRGCGA